MRWGTNIAPMPSPTDLIHHAYVPPGGFESVSPGVHKASTVIFPSVAAMRSRSWKNKSGYTYGLHGTPTTFTLEARIASLEGARHCLLAPSGLSAIALVDAALLSAGDEVLIPDNAYGPGKDFALHELARWGVKTGLYDAADPSTLAAALTADTRLIWLEAPGSVTLEFPDLLALLGIARERGILTAIDNTWGAGLAFNPFDIEGGRGADISVHALTKYPSGGGDVLMGAVSTCDERLHESLVMTHGRFGLGVGANDVELVLRGLNSLELRYDAQDAAARTLATRLVGRRSVTRVLHPALPGSPGHEQWRRLCTKAAGLFTLEFATSVSRSQCDAFVDALRVFRIGYSWGGPVSLVVPYQTAGLRARPTPYQGELVRFAVGLEAVEDLWADIDRAMNAVGI